MLRRVLSYRVSVEAMIEVVMWLLVPYIAIGLVWAFLNADRVQSLQTGLETRMPAGADIAAYLTTAALWPWELMGAEVRDRYGPE